METLSRRPGSATQRLQAGASNDFHEAAVVETDDEVALIGMVRTYYLKQMAQELVRPALGGRRLRNRLVVIPD